jgi:hypothetical protein
LNQVELNGQLISVALSNPSQSEKRKKDSLLKEEEREKAFSR